MSPLPGARPSRQSQCGRILRVLQDGNWHTASELFRAMPAGATIHSRVSELRKVWGYEIEHRTVGVGAAGSEYRLVSALNEAGGGAGESPGNLPLSDPVSLSALARPGEPARVGTDPLSASRPGPRAEHGDMPGFPGHASGPILGGTVSPNSAVPPAAHLQPAPVSEECAGAGQLSLLGEAA